jgi:putative tricarboxylic transport membrane protein
MIATIAMVLLALPVARFTTKFGPAEYFMLMILALAATASMAKGKKIKATISILIGLMISVIGIDFQSGVMRFTYGNLHLLGGIDFLVIIIAIYALGEIFGSYKIIHQKKVEVRRKFGKIRVTKDEFKKSLAPILRAAPVGFLLGALPGAGGTMAALMAYNNEKNISNEPETFGEGNIVGLAAPESANNAASVGALIPMFTLGIPGSGTTAVMLGALMMLGLQPGPQLFTQNPEFVWGVIASMFIGNIILAYVNIPLAGLLVQVLRVPSKVLFPIIAALAFIGIYSIGMSEMDLYLLVIFGIFGFFLKKAGIPTAPLILAVIVGNTMEQTFRQALTISDGDFGIFLGSPLAITLLVLTILSLIMPYSRDLKSKLFSKA